MNSRNFLALFIVVILVSACLPITQKPGTVSESIASFTNIAKRNSYQGDERLDVFWKYIKKHQVQELDQLGAINVSAMLRKDPEAEVEVQRVFATPNHISFLLLGRSKKLNYGTQDTLVLSCDIPEDPDTQEEALALSQRYDYRYVNYFKVGDIISRPGVDFSGNYSLSVWYLMKQADAGRFPNVSKWTVEQYMPFMDVPFPPRDSQERLDDLLAIAADDYGNKNNIATSWEIGKLLLDFPRLLALGQKRLKNENEKNKVLAELDISEKRAEGVLEQLKEFKLIFEKLEAEKAAKISAQ